VIDGARIVAACGSEYRTIHSRFTIRSEGKHRFRELQARVGRCSQTVGDCGGNMRSKRTTTTKKTTSAKAPSHKAKGKAKASWAQTVKQALEKRRSGGAFPKQPKPRDSNVHPLRKNAF
jgi:hypothetical protein